MSDFADEIARIEAKRIIGQFTVEPWPGGWMATAYQGGPGSSVCLFGQTEAGCVAEVSLHYARGLVPMNAIPSSEYHAEALREHARRANDAQLSSGKSS